MKFKIFVVLFLTALSFSACRQSETYTDLSDYFIYEDTTLSLTANDAWKYFQRGQFINIQGHSFNPGFTTSYYWLVVESHNVKDQSYELEIGTPQINQIECYQIRDGIPVKVYVTGDHHPFSARLLPSINFNFPLQDTVRYLLKIDKLNESLQLTFIVKPKTIFDQQALSSFFITGILTGVIVLMLVFGLFLALITKERIYFFYVLYVAAGWLYVLANLGYGYKYLWPESPWFAARARPLFTLLAVGLSLYFIEYYAGKASFRWLHITMRGLAVLSFLMALMVMLPVIDLKMNTVGYYFQGILPVMAGIYILALLTTLVHKMMNKNRMALFYLASILPIALFSVMQISYYSGGVDISGSALQQYGQATGYVLEAVILTFGLAFRFNSYRLEKERLLIEVNEQQVRYAKTIISTQESERRKLADQLHDVAGSLLSAAKLNLSSVREKEFIRNEEARVKLLQAEDAVSDISEMLRNLSHAISPVMLDKVGFRKTVEKIANLFNASGKLTVEMEIIGFDSDQPAMHERYSVLYSVLYELVNNTAKHAQATHMLIQLIEHDESIVIIVEDNGKGMNVDVAKMSATHGLAAIQSKIHYLNGIITFDKGDPRGLIVTIEIPKE